MASPEPGAAAPLSRLLKKALPWIAVAAIFAFLLHKVPLRDVGTELGRLSAARIAGLAGVSVLFILGVAVLDGLAMWRGFSAFKVKLSLKEVIWARAAMMVLTIIANLAGQAGLATYLVKKYKVPAVESAGMVMLLFLAEVYGMFAVSTLAFPVLLLLKGRDAAPAPVLHLAAAMLAGAWPALGLIFLAARSRLGSRLLEKLRLGALLLPFRTIGPAEFGRVLLLKTILAAWQIGLTWPCFLIYGIDVPVLELFALMPLTILVSSIPITPGKFGTTQLSWGYFFGHVASAQALVVFSLLLQVMLNVVRWIVGAVAATALYRDRAEKE